jgi:hypothetical protein
LADNEQTWLESTRPDGNSNELAAWVLKMLDEHKETEEQKKNRVLYGKIGKLVGLDFDDDGTQVISDNTVSMAERLEDAKQRGWIKVAGRSSEINSQAVTTDVQMGEQRPEIKKGDGRRSWWRPDRMDMDESMGDIVPLMAKFGAEDF